jgi:two-component system, OmpR family, response regulator
MENETKIKIALVDDDAIFLKMLEIEFLNYSKFEVETFATGEQCIEHLSPDSQLVVLDYNLDGINKNALNGIATLDRIKSSNPLIPVIMLSAQDRIEVAIDCIHHKAVDYVVKSETAFLRIHKIITNVLNYKKIENKLNWYMDRM